MFTFENHFDKRTIVRGSQYYGHGQVTKIQYNHSPTNPTYFDIQASVAGTHTYQTHVSLELPDSRDHELNYVSSSCSCPMLTGCKHAAAVLCEFKYQILPQLMQTNKTPNHPKESEHEKRFKSWFKKLSQKIQLEQFDSNTNIIAYVLNSYNMQLDGYRVRHRKTGSLGKPFELPAVNFIYYEANYIRDIDRHIQSMISQILRTHGFRSGFLFQGPMGAQLLEMLLKADRLFLDEIDGNHRLQMGSSASFKVRWTELDDGSIEPEYLLDNAPTGCILLPTRPATYIDTLALKCGRIEHDLPDTLYEFLLQCPLVPANEKEQLSHLLRDTSAQIANKPTLTTVQPQPSSKTQTQQSLELPVNIEETIIEHFDRPRLILSGTSSNSDYQFQACLEFDYGGHYLPAQLPEGETQTTQNNQQIRIIHQPQAEQGCIEQLKSYGLRPSYEEPSHQFLLAMPGELAVQSSYWQYFLNEGKPALEQQGWLIEFDDDFIFNVHQADDYEGEIVEDDSGWFDISLNLELEGRSIALLPLIQQWLSQGGEIDSKLPLVTQLDNGEWLSVPHAIIRPVANTLIELYDSLAPEDDSLKLSPYEAPRLEELEDSLSDDERQFEWQGGDKVRELAQRLRHCQGIQAVEPPSGLQATLRDYQKTGFNWLCFLYQYQFGGILADDMGLGKTLQVLAFLLYLKQTQQVDKPALVIVPTSLLGNWHKEATHFTPDLKVGKWYGLARHDLDTFYQQYDMIVTTYGTVMRDGKLFQAFTFESIILDEAQAIKNPSSKIGKVVRGLKAHHKLCLTGTPMENHLGELWSLFDFLMPGFLKTLKLFKQQFRTPIEKHKDMTRQKELNKRIQPFLLRRTKAYVASELPEKTQIIRYCELEGKQRQLYEAVRLSMEHKVRQLIQQKGVKRSQIEILDALLKLRQACCDPRLLSIEEAQNITQSSKLNLLMDLLPDLIEDGRKILLFSQFTSMLALIEDELTKANIPYVTLTGQTQNRDQVIEKFQNGNIPLFLISLKAGGFGLNLTAADTVIHYDPWWNPAVENQATDRTHRIGQDQKVFVYKLVASDTVEEKILSLQDKKQQIADNTYGHGNEPEQEQLTGDDLLALFKE